MRVFHLVKGLGRGGAETLLVRTASSDSRHRRNGYGYFLPWKDALVEELKANGCSVTCFQARNPLEMAIRIPAIVAHLQLWRPDLIHCHLPLAGLIGRVVGRLLKVPVIYSEHNLQERYHPLTRLANRCTWRWQQHVIAVSGEVRTSIRRALSPEVPVTTVLNGVDCQEFVPSGTDTESVRVELGLPPQGRLITTIAVFRKQKRLDLWLKAAARIAERDPELNFLIVGDGPERPTVEALVAELGLTSKVILPGLKSPIKPYLAASDIFFMSSDFEGLPVAMLEAMATGVPVVATLAGGIGEVIQDSSMGLTCAVGDVEGMVANLERLLGDPQELQRVARNGRARVEEAFSLRRMRAEIESIYQSLIPVPKPPREAPANYAFDDKVGVEEALELIRSALGPGSERNPRSQEFFQWKHSESPFGESLLLGVRDKANHELVGLRAFQRWRVSRPQDGLNLKAVRAVDTSTRPDHQRRGLFTRLTRWGLDRFSAEGGQLVFNTPNTNSLPGYLKMGWEVVTSVPVRFKWLKPGRGASARQGDSWEEVLGAGPEIWNGMLGESRPRTTLSIDKNWDYLRWRYTGHPALKYSFRARFDDGVPSALAVWCRTRRLHLKELAICELFCRSVEEGRLLLRSVLTDGDGHYGVACFHNNSMIQEVLDELGFRLVPGKVITVTALPLESRADLALHPENWTFATGDLQIF